jgi:hypothetical protein
LDWFWVPEEDFDKLSDEEIERIWTVIAEKNAAARAQEWIYYEADYDAINASGYGVEDQLEYTPVTYEDDYNHEAWVNFTSGSHWYLLPGYATDPRGPGMGSPLGYSFGNSWDAFGANGQNYIKGYTSLYLYDFTKEQDSALRALA